MVRSNSANRNSSVLEQIKEKGDNERQIAPSSFNTIVWTLKHYEYKSVSPS